MHRRTTGRTLLLYFIATTCCAALTSTAGAADAPAAIDATVNRTNFLVANLDRSLGLYRDILGFKVDAQMPVRPEGYMYDIFNVPRSAQMRLAFLSGGDGKFGTLGLTEVKGAEVPKASGAHRSVLIVETRTRFDAMYEGVRKAGLETTQVFELTRPDRREFMLTDADGHRVLVMELRPGRQ